MLRSLNVFMSCSEQALGQDGWILAKFFLLCLFIDRDENQNYKTELLYGKRTLFSCWTQRVIRSAILPAREANQKGNLLNGN